MSGGGRTIKAEVTQDYTYLFEAIQGRPGRAERHAGAERGVKHPGGNHGGRVVGDAADENDFSSLPHLPVLDVNVSPARRMPRIVETCTK